MYYCEWSAHTPVAVVDSSTRSRFWFDQLDDTHKDEALNLPVFDINRGRIVDAGDRKHTFFMNRRHIHF